MVEVFDAFLEMRREASKGGGAFNRKVRRGRSAEAAHLSNCFNQSPAWRW